MKDSTSATKDHILMVRMFAMHLASEIIKQTEKHDQSKLETPEKEIFDEMTEKLKGLTYGSEEYKKTLKAMRPALEHHYKANRHHPEHHTNSIDGMTLVDVIEMFVDWCAATERHADGDILKSIDNNQERFGLSDQLAQIFRNTARTYKMGKGMRE